MMTEQWLPVPGFEELYEVSDLGRVRSLCPRRGDGIMRGYVDRYGYRTVLLTRERTAKRYKVHRLVCHAFNGPPPEGLFCGHNNGDPSDNRATNLRWLTRSENSKDMVRHGRHVAVRNLTPGVGCGTANPSAKYSDETIAAIRADRETGMSIRALAHKHGVSRAHVHHVVAGHGRRNGGNHA